jgi:ketosteroid isomerase-like protein
LQKWIDTFNKADLEAISDLHADNAIKHQVASEPVDGKIGITLNSCGKFKTFILNYF